MDKHKQKKNNYNHDAIRELMKIHGYTKNYILKSIRGERVGSKPVEIKEAYERMERASRKVIRDVSDKLQR